MKKLSKSDFLLSGLVLTLHKNEKEKIENVNEDLQSRQGIISF